MVKAIIWDVGGVLVKMGETPGYFPLGFVSLRRGS